MSVQLCLGVSRTATLAVSCTFLMLSLCLNIFAKAPWMERYTIHGLPQDPQNSCYG